MRRIADVISRESERVSERILPCGILPQNLVSSTDAIWCESLYSLDQPFSTNRFRFERDHFQVQVMSPMVHTNSGFQNGRGREGCLHNVCSQVESK